MRDRSGRVELSGIRHDIPAISPSSRDRKFHATDEDAGTHTTA